MSNQFNNNQKCRIADCPYEVSPYFEKLGVCKVHTKKCQGVISGQWERTNEGVNWRYQKVQCDIAVPIDGEDFCEGCKNQTETYQQWKTRTESEDKQKFEKWCQVHEKAQSWWSVLSPQEMERECERLAEKIVKESYTASGWVHTGSFWGIENGKFTSSSPNLVPIEIIQEFAEKEIGFCDSKMIEYFESQMVVRKNDSDNLPQTSQPKNEKCVECGAGRDEEIRKGCWEYFIVDGKTYCGSCADKLPKKSEIEQEQTKLNALREKNQNASNPDEKKRLEQSIKDTENKLKNLENKNLVVDLKNVKKITLREDGKLEIEFNGNQNDQIIGNEQVNDSQELQKIKNYCQERNIKSLNQQELNNFLADTNTATAEKPHEGNNSLLTATIVGGALILGITAGLFLMKKKNRKN